jgi:hypothetical protein
VDLITHLHLVASLKMSATMPPLSIIHLWQTSEKNLPLLRDIKGHGKCLYLIYKYFGCANF